MTKLVKAVQLLYLTLVKMTLTKLSIANILLAPVPRYLSNHVRPRVYRAIGLSIGSGTSISGNLTLDIYTGSYSNLRIGKNVRVSHHVFITLNDDVTIGDEAAIGPFVKIITDTHQTSNPERRHGPIVSKPINIGKGAFIGTGVILLPGVTVGEGAVVTAGSVVTRDIPPHTLAVGNPVTTGARLSRPKQAEEEPVAVASS